jgi:hypothetical protein
LWIGFNAIDAKMIEYHLEVMGMVMMGITLVNQVINLGFNNLIDKVMEE